MAADLDRRVAELSTLHAIGEVLNGEADFAVALQQALERLVELVGCDTAWVFLTRAGVEDPHYGGWDVTAAVGLPAALAAAERRALREGSCECEGMFRRGELDEGCNIVECSRLNGAAGDTGGLEIHASVPLQGRAAPVGILNLASPGPEPFDAETLSLADAVGAQLGVAYERALLLAERERDAAERATRAERDRIAREAHDSVSQLLFGASLALQVAGRTSERERVDAAVARAAEHVDAGLGELRRLVELLRSAHLDEGLDVALRRLGERASGTMKVHVHAAPLDLPEASAEALYRCAQEGVHNAMRHGEPNHVWITLEQRPSREGRRVALLVSDDGVGLPAEPVAGIGLESMRARLEELGGRLRLAPRREGGTRLEVVVPWRSAS